MPPDKCNSSLIQDLYSQVTAGGFSNHSPSDESHEAVMEHMLIAGEMNRGMSHPILSLVLEE